jgi:hypothetical protein
MTTLDFILTLFVLACAAAVLAVLAPVALLLRFASVERSARQGVQDSVTPRPWGRVPGFSYR